MRRAASVPSPLREGMVEWSRVEVPTKNVLVLVCPGSNPAAPVAD